MAKFSAAISPALDITIFGALPDGY